jgi:flagellar basal body-associated protein FliL
VTRGSEFTLSLHGDQTDSGPQSKGGFAQVSILWIILIVILVLALLGFFSRGYW